ncbi:uncharacterized protein L3040_006436 [Drepanopeziza brunnea f. sp. 'multigermtubi']|uniref:Conserved fungal protein n=1 Tax=Marssonina brunnea f. sp. multigermtubi (strain MB_m1) TaxID=1072389 RepID=K1Y6A4_MARBU|nr:uncharacterized protein MBM_01396 [Drepanopeziza brunnea f. sp. 'multigermtubi' MB_m1]EKD20714.1 conserved fungal protein [Drepanopeziza brunnea f. sp. 'multigermtubi' MB_m1]KAJ5038756.1 hypothetical protein L3040_006436 [Drepanopeziza brunnea f. sp. 'multigermtubi']
MNNDPAATDLPSSETPLPEPASVPIPGPSASNTAPAGGGGDDDEEDIPVIQSNVLTPAQQKAQSDARALFEKKHEFITSLTSNLDVLIYAELSILYYMDCSLFRFLLRVLNQMMFLTPKPSFVPPAPQHRPYIGAIVLPNMICVLLHLFTARPEAGEAMRGYLHGGVIIDLIGYKGPTSRFHMILLDLLVLSLQFFMLAVHVEKEKLSAIIEVYKKNDAVPVTAVSVAPTQDLDAEERGEIGHRSVRRNGDMEMQEIIPQNDGPSSITRIGETDEERNEERERLLAEPSPAQEEVEDGSTLELLWSASAVVAEFNIFYNLRRQWRDYGSATESALQTVGFSAEFAAITANRRINAASARLQRDVEALGRN